MNTCYELIINEDLTIDFEKDEDYVSIPLTINQFAEAKRIIDAEYERQEQNKRVHGLEINPEIEKLHNVYTATFEYLAKQEEVRAGE